jgi:hypothetical protein
MPAAASVASAALTLSCSGTRLRDAKWLHSAAAHSSDEQYLEEIDDGNAVAVVTQIPGTPPHTAHHA